MTELFLMTRAQLAAWTRSRSYLSSIAAGFGLVVISAAVNETAGTEAWRVLTDFGLLFTTSICSFVGVSLALNSLTAPDELLQLQQLAVRPVRRSSILLSRLLAAEIATLLSCVIIGLALLVTGIAASVPHPFRIIPALICGAQEPILATAIAICLASNSSRLVAGIVTFSSYFILRFAIPAADLQGGYQYLRYLPRFDRFSLAEWVHDGALPTDLWFRVAYSVCFLVLLTGIGVWRFDERDLAARS